MRDLEKLEKSIEIVTIIGLRFGFSPMLFAIRYDLVRFFEAMALINSKLLNSLLKPVTFSMTSEVTSLLLPKYPKSFSNSCIILDKSDPMLSASRIDADSYTHLTLPTKA